MPPPQLTATNDVTDSGFYVDEYSHDVYENDDVSNPDSYHSNASHHSNHSSKSNRSKSRERNKSRDRNQVSYHSFYNDDDYIGDIDQGFDDSRDVDQGYSKKNQPMHVNQFDNDPQKYNSQYFHHQNYHNPQYDHDFISAQSPKYEQDDFQNHSYQQYEETEHDYKDDTTTFSDATRQVSNVNPDQGMHSVEQLSEANSERSYEEEEESISNIFKSLSEIQTKLAKKGKTSSKEKGRKMSSLSSNNSDGLVEDVSVDGSQMSSYEAKAAVNRRPSAGNWMEPVDEHES